jgi:glucokinase
MDYIGIDIGGTQVKLGLVTEEGTVKNPVAFDVAFDGYDTPIITTVKEKLAWFLKEYSLSENNIAGIGVSATGQIDSRAGKVIGAAGHIKNWIGCEIRSEIKTLYNGPVSVMNDANCAALAELWLGGAKNTAEAVVITYGTGVGGGVIVRSEILEGVAGCGGELGHIPIRNNGRMCSCGNRGCYEQYASTTALVKMVTKAVKAGKIPVDVFENKVINGRTIFAAAGENAKLQALLDSWIDCVAAGLVGIIHTFNPQVVLIGGGVSAQEELFIVPLREKVLSRVMPEFAKVLRLEAATLKNDAGMVGAVYYCMKQGK